MMNNICYRQNNNCYFLYLTDGKQVAVIEMPPDSQYAVDCKALEIITKALAMRYGVYTKNRKGSSGNS
jgi:hypothetical protein